MTWTGRALGKLPYNKATAKLWDMASWRFARGAKGDAHVFFGRTVRPDSVFMRIEAPVLNRRGVRILQHFVESP